MPFAVRSPSRDGIKSDEPELRASSRSFWRLAVPQEPSKTVDDAAEPEPKETIRLLRGSRDEKTIGPPVRPDTSLLSRVTIMIPRPRPDHDISEERRRLKDRIKKNGLRKTVDELLEEYYRWKEDPDPVSARRRRRATLIFSKPELSALIPIEIQRLVGDFEFLAE
jgi:hypothetical protein